LEAVAGMTRSIINDHENECVLTECLGKVVEHSRYGLPLLIVAFASS